MGDTNLDYLRWNQPERHLVKMVDKTKEEIETRGFHQMIGGVTRTWPGQLDSNLDQCWMNAPQKLIYFRNLVRLSSDHNLILISLRTKNRLADRHEMVRRNRNEYDASKYREDMARIDWSEYYELNSIDLISDFFQTEVLKVLNKHAPMQTLQRRRRLRNWVSGEVKQMMSERDRLREVARLSDDRDDWQIYRTERNRCTRVLRSCKTDYYRDLYKKMEQEKDTAGIYKLNERTDGCEYWNNSTTIPQRWSPDKKTWNNGEHADATLY